MTVKDASGVATIREKGRGKREKALSLLPFGLPVSPVRHFVSPVAKQ
jgi:hypothetical protein